MEASTLEVSAGASPVINVFTNGGTECTLHVFTDDTKLGGVVDKPDICAAIQGDVDKLEKAGKQEHHGEKKCEVLQLGKTPMLHSTLGADQLESSFVEKCLGIVVDNK